MEKFKLWDMPINSFSQKLKNLTLEAKKKKKINKEFKRNSSGSFFFLVPLSVQ